MKWIFLSAALLCACVSAPAADPFPEGTAVHKDLPYVKFDKRRHERHKLDLIIPPHAEGEKLPLVIWIHGGAFWAGNKEDWTPATPLVSKGFAHCRINYRYSNSSVFPGPLQDCKAAVRWLRAHAAEYDLDPDRIGVWGSSAGGYFSSMLGVTGGVKEFEWGENLDQSSRVQCVVDYFGPTDFSKMNEQAKDVDAPFQFDHDGPDSPESLLLGAPVQEAPERVKAANPCTYASPDDAPILIVHGKKDPIVAFGQSELLRDALQAAGVAVDFHAVENAGHGNGFGEAEQKVAEDFLIRHLHPSGNE